MEFVQTLTIRILIRILIRHVVNYIMYYLTCQDFLGFREKFWQTALVL